MKKILIIASNPRKDLNLDREIRDLKGVIKRSRNKAQFEMEIELAVRPDDLQELFLENEPRIVHFCGHGTGEQGLVLENDAGREKLVSTNALSSLFEFFDNKVECVLLNACYSDVQANAIIQHINYVVGMSQEIRDDAAIAFATGFYRGLGYGKSIEQSYKLGCNAIQLQIDNNVTSRSRSDETSRKLGAVNPVEQVLIPEHLKPRLKKKQPLTPFVESDSSTQPNIPPESIEALKEAVKEEVARKEYKDQVREAYDNFGQFSAANVTSLTKHEYKQRKIVLSKVKEFWIEGFLKPSLQGNSAISLDLKARPDVLSDFSQSIEALSVELDESFEELQTTRIYEEMGQGRTLLILGNPGAGKTIALLQLAQRLVERSEQDLCLPIPVVFNLSSWGKDQKPIVDWLIDELREKYQVSKALSEPWITQWQLILLLDGLDEVNADYRNDCVRDLNKFIGLFPHTEMAVCSRVQDYEYLTERLQISSAICIQPLVSKQVYQFLDSVGGSLTGLKTLLKNNAELEQFAQTPLILNMMSLAYQGWSAEKLMQQLRSTPDRYQQHLFDTYIERRLQRGASSEYTKDYVLQWLSWLATRMVQEKQTVFLIEKMQPTWLQDGSDKNAYHIRNYITFRMIYVPIYGLLNVLILGPFIAVILGQGFALIFGLIAALISGVGHAAGYGGLANKMKLVEQLNWFPQNVKHQLIYGLSSALSSALFMGLIYGLRYEVFMGLLMGLFIGLIPGLSFTEVEQRTIPNQGIWSSAKNGLIYGLGSGLIAGLSFGLSSGLGFGLMTALMAAVYVGLLSGGAVCIQHFNLRLMLHHRKRIPWNYARFLDFASERYLLRKVGGGYIFFHRMLMEHFARMNSD